MAGSLTRLAVEIHEWTEAVGLASDGDHDRQAERSCADHRLGRSPDTDPNRHRILQGPGMDLLIIQRRAMPPRPGDPRLVTDLQQQEELFIEEGVVIPEIESEEGIGLGEGAAPGDDLGTPL